MPTCSCMYMYVCTWACVCVSDLPYLHVCVSRCVCTNFGTSALKHACGRIQTWAQVRLSMHADVQMLLSLYLDAYVTHQYMHTHTHTCMCTHTHICMHACMEVMRADARYMRDTSIHAHTHTHMHACMHVNNACIDANIITSCV